MKNFDILKKYVDELSEMNFNESIKGVSKKSPTINKYLKTNRKKTTRISYLSYYRHDSKKRSTIRKNSDKYSFNLFNSRIRFKPRPIFENIEEFNDYMKSSRTKIENLLMEDNKISIEVANLRDYYLLHQEEINKTKLNKLLLINQFNKLNQELLDAKTYNEKLEKYKNNLMFTKEKKTFIKVSKKIKEVLNNIYELYNKNINEIIKKKNIDKPILALNELEKVIIYLINFNSEQKSKNREIYNEIIKRLDKNKRLAIIKQKREEDELRIKRKCQELIEKDLKILNINNRRNNIYFRHLHYKKKKKKEEVIEEKKDIIDISY